MNRNRKSRYTKKSITAAVCFSMVLGNTLPVIAAENPQKEENVYDIKLYKEETDSARGR